MTSNSSSLCQLTRPRRLPRSHPKGASTDSSKASLPLRPTIHHRPRSMSVDNPRRIRAGAFGLGRNHQMTRLGAYCELDSCKFTNLTHLHVVLTAGAEMSMPLYSRHLASAQHLRNSPWRSSTLLQRRDTPVPGRSKDCRRCRTRRGSSPPLVHNKALCLIRRLT